MNQMNLLIKAAKKLCKWCIPIILAILLSDFAITYLQECRLKYTINILDIYQILFFSNQYLKYEYIVPENIYCYFPVFFYYFFGALLTILPFIWKNKKSTTFLFVRYKSSKATFCHFKGSSLLPHLLYTVVFLVCVHIYCYIKSPMLYETVALSTLFIISIVCCIHNALILSMLHCFAFLIFRKKDEGYAICYTIFLLLFLLLIDIPIRGLCVITFDYGLSQIASTGAALICFCFFHHKATSQITAKEIF